MDGPEANADDAYAAATRVETLAQISSSLTFHPARDNPAQLRSFLNGVCEKYARQTNRLQQSSRRTGQPGQSAHLNELYQQIAGQLVHAGPIHAGLVMARPLPVVAPSALSQLGDRKRPAVDLNNPPPAAPRPPEAAVKSNQPESPPMAGMPAPARRGHRRRSTNQASLLRAKNIDFHKADPEEESPPNETEDERRRRRERINGRRKRAKKMIEIDFLNEQYHTLRSANTRLKNENDGFRERISMLRQFLDSNYQAPARRAQEPNPASVVVAQPKAAPANDENSTVIGDQKPSPEQKAEFDRGQPQRRALLQYALAPSALALRHMREDDVGTRVHASPSEETKDSLVQPQFVGQERLGNLPRILAGSPSILDSLQAGAPLPPSSSIVSALFQHRHNAAALPLAHSPGDSLLSSPSVQLLLHGGANQREQLAGQLQQLQLLQLLQQQLQFQHQHNQNQQARRDSANDQNQSP